MKKLNNKGFAITTLLYGLMSMAFLMVSLLMGIMSQNRQNTAALVRKIEDELNRYGETESTFGFVEESQEYFIPYGQAGWYKIELWGASSNKGLGSYTSGVIYLKESEVLYFYLGKDSSGGENVFNDSNTEVRLQNSTWNDRESKNTTIMRAGGRDEDFISGYAGMNAANSSGSVTNSPLHYSGKHFINGIHIENVNSGVGKANVELLLQVNDPGAGVLRYPDLDSDVLNNVRCIKYLSSGNTVNGGNHLIEIQAIDRNTGQNVLLGKAGNVSTDGYANNYNHYIGFSYNAQIYDLSRAYDLSEIAIWNFYGDRRSYYNQKLEVSSDCSNYREVTGNNPSTGRIEIKDGFHYSAWQPLPAEPIKSGNYYILTSGSDNVALTTKSGITDPSKNHVNVSFETFQGSKYQKWSVERIDNIYSTNLSTEQKEKYKNTPIYKVTDSKYKNVLQVERAAPDPGENVSAHSKYRGFDWDLWAIIPQKNGTYKIQSLMSDSLFLTATDNSFNASSNAIIHYDLTQEQEKNDFTRRFVFINAGK